MRHSTALELCNLPFTLPEIRQAVPKHSTPWTKHDLRRLVRWSRKGAKPSTIAKALGRSNNSVLAQMQNMGIVLSVFTGRILDDHEPEQKFYKAGKLYGRWQPVKEFRYYCLQQIGSVL
tara:strand:+ start:158 stop:514 length:357 start_codon:yes stop_codon:yes gene_type:complete